MEHSKFSGHIWGYDNLNRQAMGFRGSLFSDKFKWPWQAVYRCSVKNYVALTIYTAFITWRIIQVPVINGFLEKILVTYNWVTSRKDDGVSSWKRSKVMSLFRIVLFNLCYIHVWVNETLACPIFIGRKFLILPWHMLGSRFVVHGQILQCQEFLDCFCSKV